VALGTGGAMPAPAPLPGGLPHRGPRLSCQREPTQAYP